MQQTVDAIKTALRVLNALVVNGEADPSDLAELRRLSPSLADAPQPDLRI
jgi:hypothetical protein